VPPAARTHTIPPPTPELLTESFCERCGTRYTFESAAPKARRPGLGRARVLSRGLKNWVVEDGRSIEAAMADARRDEERTLASAQLEAFHQTFNFCMDCRQYTCSDCWNQADGRCQSCAPLPGMLDLHAAATNGAEAGMAWPTVDLSTDEATEVPAETTVVAAAEAVPYIPTDLRPVELPDDDDFETAIGLAAAAALGPMAEVSDEAKVIEVEPEAVNLAAAGAVEAEGVAFEAVAAEAEPEAMVVEAVEVEAIGVEAEAEPEVMIVAEAETEEAEEAEPIAAAEAEPIEPVVPPAAREPEPITRTPTPGWAIVAPDGPSDTPSAPPAWPPQAPVYQPPSQAPQPPGGAQPAQPAWPTVPPAAFSVPAAQAVWEESSLGVIGRPGSGVQACVSCGLPLSATARFCRRCGTRQG
jgi:hypothetical protein